MNGQRRHQMTNSRETLLCVANFSTKAGFAWSFIENLYARVADHLAVHGIGTLVAYPSIPSEACSLRESAARPIELDASLRTTRSVRAVRKVILTQNVKVIYFTDRPAWSWAYVLLRRAGVRRIIVHDHASGERTRPRGLKRAAKWLLGRAPGIVADVVIAVSEYVARRQIEVGVIPPSRVKRLWNGVPLPPLRLDTDPSAHTLFGLAPERPLIVCTCRAVPEKGVAYLLRAFDRAARALDGTDQKPVLLYLGDGPQFAEIKALRAGLASKDDIILAGYRSDSKQIVESADICVVPSVWQEAFGLVVLEAMACSKPVIATRVGGIPELIQDDVHGLLVPPADENALSSAILSLITDPARAARLGAAARERVAEWFQPEESIACLLQILEVGFGTPCEAVRAAALRLARAF